MKLPVGIWLAAHASITLAALRASERLAPARGLTGAGLVIVGGLLVVTLLASLRDPRRTAGQGLIGYCSATHRLPKRCDFLGASVVCILWFALCSSPFFTGFKLCWLGAALLAAHAIARPHSYCSREIDAPTSP